MSCNTNGSTVDDPSATPTQSQSPFSGAEFAQVMSEMVADQAPPMFAVVIELGNHADAQVVAWGIELDDAAYMVTVDGRNKYALASAESALKYIRSNNEITPHLVWATPRPGSDE